MNPFNEFVQNMTRRHFFATGVHAVGWPALALAGRSREGAATVVPPHGLTLEEVRYPSDGELAARAEQTRRRREPVWE